MSKLFDDYAEGATTTGKSLKALNTHKNYIQSASATVEQLISKTRWPDYTIRELRTNPQKYGLSETALENCISIMKKSGKSYYYEYDSDNLSDDKDIQGEQGARLVATLFKERSKMRMQAILAERVESFIKKENINEEELASDADMHNDLIESAAFPFKGGDAKHDMSFTLDLATQLLQRRDNGESITPRIFQNDEEYKGLMARLERCQESRESPAVDKAMSYFSSSIEHAVEKVQKIARSRND